MDLDEARAALRVGADAGRAELRGAYRRLLRAHHPDIVGPTGTDDTALIIEAYATCLVDADEPVSDELPSSAPDENDTLILGCPADEAFAALLSAAHELGDVTYLDRQSPLLEALLRTVDGVTVSVVISLQGRAHAGTTDAFFSVEPLSTNDRLGVPAVGAVVDLFARQLSASSSGAGA